MDSLTQFTLGAAVGQAVAGRKLGSKALLWGGLAGTIPDFDVAANFFINEIDAMAFHRGITHSIFFAFLMPLPIIWLIKRFTKDRGPSYNEWYLLFFLGFITHIFIDACTTYGTQVFQPFSDTRIAFNNISVADPFYTVPFFLCVLASAFFKKTNPWKNRLNWAGIIISSIYLAFTFVNLYRVNEAFKSRMAIEQVEYSRYTTNPTILNNFLWHAVAETPDGYVESYYSFFDEEAPFKRLMYHDKSWDLIQDCQESHDVEILKWFANGYYIIGRNPGTGELTFNDLRFGAFWDDEDDDPTFIFNFFLDECRAITNREQPEDFNEFFNKFVTRVKGI